MAAMARGRDTHVGWECATHVSGEGTSLPKSCHGARVYQPGSYKVYSEPDSFDNFMIPLQIRAGWEGREIFREKEREREREREREI